MKDLDYILESYIIDDYYANEGQNLQSAKNIKESKEYKDLVSTLKNGKMLEKNYKKTKNLSSLEGALKAYKEVIPKIHALKGVIDDQPEPDGFWSKLCASLTPSLFNFTFPKDEETGSMILPNGNGGLMRVRQYKNYDDSLSESTDSALKKRYQQGMNKLMKDTQQKIRALELRVGRLKRDKSVDDNKEDKDDE
jgi:hypothetical protein